MTWTCSFKKNQTLDFFDGLSEYNSNIKWNIFEEENKDWLEEWKKGFKPFKLVGDFWVVPSWLQPPQNANMLFTLIREWLSAQALTRRPR